MNGIKDAVLRMVRAYRKVEEIRKAYVKCGFNDDILFDAAGDIQDAVFAMIGETRDDDTALEDTVTYISLNTPILSVERRTEMLMAAYRKNHHEQPKPDTIEPEKMRKMVKQNGGYLYETPEGDWS